MSPFVSLLRNNHNYRNTWIGQVVSEIGDHFNNIAVFGLVLAHTRSGMVVTGVMLARAIPAILAGPLAGVVLDRFDRKRVMIASDLIRAHRRARLHPHRQPRRYVAGLSAERTAHARLAVLLRRTRLDSARHRHHARNCTPPTP